jgi:alpha-L-fucosidase
MVSSLLLSAVPLLSCALASVDSGVCRVGNCNDTVTYPNTIDCASSSPTKGWTTKNSCDLEGDFSAINGRALPDWYADMKLGIFIHWGVYSVPSFGSEWFWHNAECAGAGPASVKAFQDKNFGPDWKYPDYANLFRAELFNATAWLETFKGAGAQYILPVAKHHDGFCMWNATGSSPGWNAVEVGPRRDVMQELYDATGAAGLGFGLYFSQFEWFDENYVKDYQNNFTTTTYIDKKMRAQRRELVERFPKSMLWHTDGGWMAPDAYWGNLEWLTWLYSDASPLSERVVTCNSMGFGCCQQIGSKCWEYGDAPSGGDRTTAGAVVNHFYTNQMTIQQGSWSYDRSEPLAQYLTAAQLVKELVQTTAWNGTLVMNVGPTPDGRLDPIFEERFAQVGSFLEGNGAAIYGTRPWRGSLPSGAEAGGNVYYTAAKDGKTVYAIVLEYPEGGALHLAVPQATTAGTTATLLSGGALQWVAQAGGGMTVSFPPLTPALATQLGWAIALKGLVNN